MLAAFAGRTRRPPLHVLTLFYFARLSTTAIALVCSVTKSNQVLQSALPIPPETVWRRGRRIS